MLLSTACALVATWSFSGFYQAFAPGVTADYLGTSNALMIAVVFSSVVVLSPLGGSVAGRLRPVVALRIGLAVFMVATVVIVVALHAEAILPFLIVSAIAGTAQGASDSGGMRAVFAHVLPEDRAGTLATLYLISYGGAALPGLAAGQLSHTLALPDVATCYAMLVVVSATLALVTSRTRARSAPVDGRLAYDPATVVQQAPLSSTRSDARCGQGRAGTARKRIGWSRGTGRQQRTVHSMPPLA